MNTTKLFVIPDGRFLLNVPSISLQVLFNSEAEPNLEAANYDEDTINSFQEIGFESEIQSIAFNAMSQANDYFSSKETQLIYALVNEKCEDSDFPTEREEL